MALPKRVYVFGQQIKVVVSKVPVVVGDLSFNPEKHAGEFFPLHSIILVDGNLPTVDQEHTLLHEMFHVMCRRVGINQSNISNEMEEVLCENFSTTVLENFKIRKRK